MKRINIPQPVWPELAYYEGDTLHKIVPVITKDGATYDISKHGAKAEALVYLAVAQKVKDDPTKVIRVIKASDVGGEIKRR